MGRRHFSLISAIGAALVFGLSVASAQTDTDGAEGPVSAPRIVGETVAFLEEEYNFKVLLSEMFAWGTDEQDVEKFTSAIAVGQSRVGHRVCDQHAFWSYVGDHFRAAAPKSKNPILSGGLATFEHVRT